MLVLSRKRGEVIIVPKCEWTVTVLAVQGNTVRLDIAAPTEIDIYREEIWQTINHEGERPSVKE